MDPIALDIDWEQIVELVTAGVEAKLEAAGKGNLMVEPGSLDNARENFLRCRLVARPKPEPAVPTAMTLDEFLAAQPRASDTLPYTPGSQRTAEREAHVERLPRLPEEEEPPPLMYDHQGLFSGPGYADVHGASLEAGAVPPGTPVLYHAPPPVSSEARQQIELLKAQGILPGHMTAELLASSSREDVLDGVGEVLKGGYIKGTTPPAGHEDDPHKNKPWRRKTHDIRDVMRGEARQTTS